METERKIIDSNTTDTFKGMNPEETELKPTPSLFGIFTSPVEQFERIRNNPKIWIPLIIVAVVNVIGMAIMATMMDADMLIKQGVPEKDADMVLNITKIAMVVTGVLTPVISVLVASAIQLAISKFAKTQVSFKQLFSMNIFITFITAVGHLLNMIVGKLIGGDAELHVTSIAGLLGKEDAPLLGSIELFAIWAVVLTAFGLHKTAGFSKGLAWAISIIFFLISIGFALVGTLLQGATQL